MTSHVGGFFKMSPETRSILTAVVYLHVFGLAKRLGALANDGGVMPTPECRNSGPCGMVCVCVEHLYRCKTSDVVFVYTSRGAQHFTGIVSNKATTGMGYPVWPIGRTCFRHSNRLS